MDAGKYHVNVNLKVKIEKMLTGKLYAVKYNTLTDVL